MNRVLRCLVGLFLTSGLFGYSVLTHEAIIDVAWEQSLKPLLIKRFPASTPDDLVKAHAYAYGGAIIQDMGYYPFGSKLFSDLVHYVRSGDYVLNQIAESQDLNEYAFALGSLAHYAADTEGHSIGVNPSVGIEYPKLEREYGKSVTYAENPGAHLKVEFGFDVLQVANGNYAPQSYHDFIGFQVAKPLMERAFHDTYGLELKSIFTDLDLALGTYRRAVSSVIPEMTKVAWSIKKDQLKNTSQGMTRAKFIYNLSRASFEKEWDHQYQKPGPGARILAFFFHLVPKIGPFKAAAFKMPTPETSRLFQDSFDKTVDVYRTLLSDVNRRQLRLQNMNFDTGTLTTPATYTLADNAYSKLAIKLSDQAGGQGAGTVDPKMCENIIAYYRNPDLAYATKKDPGEWQRTLAAVDKLKAQTSTY